MVVMAACIALPTVSNELLEDKQLEMSITVYNKTLTVNILYTMRSWLVKYLDVM